MGPAGSFGARFLHNFANFFGNPHAPEPEEVQMLGIFQNPGRPFNPIGNVQLHYHNGAFDQRQPSPKPAHEPPPDASPGFTRETGSDVVFICPACNEELAYDPLGPGDNAHPSKPTKGKRSKSEHHFWALKACGHVRPPVTNFVC
jgi:hypothetical protein